MVYKALGVSSQPADLNRNVLFVQPIIAINQDGYGHIHRRRGPATPGRESWRGSIVACAAIGLGCGQAAARNAHLVFRVFQAIILVGAFTAALSVHEQDYEQKKGFKR